MNKSSEDTETLGKRIAQEVAHQSSLEEHLSRYLERKSSLIGGTFRLMWAVIPGVLIIIASDISFPSRAIVGVAVSIAFGAVVEYVRMERRLNTAIRLLLLLARKK